MVHLGDSGFSLLAVQRRYNTVGHTHKYALHAHMQRSMDLHRRLPCGTAHVTSTFHTNNGKMNTCYVRRGRGKHIAPTHAAISSLDGPARCGGWLLSVNEFRRPQVETHALSETPEA